MTKTQIFYTIFAPILLSLNFECFVGFTAIKKLPRTFETLPRCHGRILGFLITSSVPKRATRTHDIIPRYSYTTLEISPKWLTIFNGFESTSSWLLACLAQDLRRWMRKSHLVFFYMHQMLLTFDSTPHNLHHLCHDCILELNFKFFCCLLSSAISRPRLYLSWKQWSINIRSSKKWQIPISRSSSNVLIMTDDDVVSLATFTPSDNFIRTSHKQWLKMIFFEKKNFVICHWIEQKKRRNVKRDEISCASGEAFEFYEIVEVAAFANNFSSTHHLMRWKCYRIANTTKWKMSKL